MFKTIIAVVNFFILLLVLIGPLVPFADFLHGTSVHEITNTQLTIGVTSNSGIDLGLLFKSELTLNSEKLDFDQNEKWKFLYNTKFYKESNPHTIRLVTMSSYSQTFHDFMLDDDYKDKSFDNFLDGGSIHINLGFTVIQIYFLILIFRLKRGNSRTHSAFQLRVPTQMRSRISSRLTAPVSGSTGKCF